jgi:hypothetical protein
MRKGDLLNIDANPKTVKGRKLGIATAIQYLSPATISGKNLCPYASAGCISACLNTAGRGIFETIQTARLNRSRLFIDSPAEYFAKLVKELAEFERQTVREGLRGAVRLNGTSDVMWERIAAIRDGVKYPNIMTAFPELVFYDYTKIPIQYRGNLPVNYSLTFSLSESNTSHAVDALARGVNVAVVFANAEKIPAVYMGVPVIIGDDSDARFLDDTRRGGYVVALYAKGRARKDISGFVKGVK